MAVLDQLKIPERIIAELDLLLPTIVEPNTPLAIPLTSSVTSVGIEGPQPGVQVV